jgi:hypothetical protein
VIKKRGNPAPLRYVGVRLADPEPVEWASFVAHHGRNLWKTDDYRIEFTCTESRAPGPLRGPRAGHAALGRRSRRAPTLAATRTELAVDGYGRLFA